MATENQNLPVRQYTKQYMRILKAVFAVKNAFQRLLSPLQTLDGVEQNKTAFSVKTCNTPVVVGDYNTGANVGFGTGTGSSSRFGNRTEIIYGDVDVPYDYTLAIHEGIDRYTVNNRLDAAVADRLRLHSEAQTRKMNNRIGAFISANAGKVLALVGMAEDALTALFDSAAAHFTNSEVDASLVAYVTPELYNALVNHGLAVREKGSGVDIDSNGIYKFKNFAIESTPNKYFATGEVAYFGADGIIIPFVGIVTTRTIPSEDFDGNALQAAAKGGTFMLDDNKVALVKVTYTDPLEPEEP
ncbi:MAG: hypothetical protein FWF10_00595 [Clostridiales bacterium]|nr:hypothetical protein [Clostridiales bacterium]